MAGNCIVYFFLCRRLVGWHGGSTRSISAAPLEDSSTWLRTDVRHWACCIYSEATINQEDKQLGVPLFQLSFLFLILLDISSHWCQMHSTMMSSVEGKQQTRHHKSAESNADRNILVRLYYQYYWFFGYCCVGAEFTYICLYIRQYVNAESFLATINTALLYACLPGCVMKQVVNVAQLTSACHAVAAYDAHERNNKVQK